MFFLGIDVGKAAHEAALLDEAEQVVWRLRFASTKAGLQALAERLAGLSAQEVVVGFEATSMFWLTLHAWLQAQGFAAVFVLNPLQTKAFRNANLRGSKTDRIDAVAIARLLRWSRGTLSAHTVPAERVRAARELQRLRVEMTQLRGRQLVRLEAVLERVFPEFAAHFASLGSRSALAVLGRWPTPAALGAAEEREIRAVLHRASRGHYGAKRAAAKAAALHQAAVESVGLADPYDAAATAIRTLIGHLDHLSAQIERLGERVDALLAQDPAQGEDRALLASIPGVGEETQRTWLAEAPPLAPFRAARNGADKLVAHVGIDVIVKQSGRWAGRAKMSKRGNRYLRRALMLAAERAARHDPQFGAILKRQQLRGKHYRVAVSHVAHKLVHVIFAVLTHRTPYELPPAYRLGIIEPVEPAEDPGITAA
jgi:transposase